MGKKASGDLDWLEEPVTKLVEKLEEPHLFWLIVGIVLLSAGAYVLPHFLAFLNARLEIKRKWEHKNTKLQSDYKHKMERRRNKKAKELAKQSKTGKGDTQ